MSADFQFRYAEGWFVGPFGTAADARWHLGNLASFVAWMVLMAIAMLVGLPLMGLSAALLAVFAPDLALVLAAVAALLCLPVVVRGWAKNRRSDFRRNGVEL